MSDVKVTKDLENKTLIIEYLANGPVEKVWQAYADKETFEKWWGPEGWETTTKEFNFAVGGRIHYCMKCVDKNQGEWFGQESWGLMEIESIEQFKKFRAKDNFCNPDGTIDENMPTQIFEVEFVEAAGKTRLISRSITDTTEQLEQLVKMGMVEGFSSQLNRLDALLQQ